MRTAPYRSQTTVDRPSNGQFQQAGCCRKLHTPQTICNWIRLLCRNCSVSLLAHQSIWINSVSVSIQQKMLIHLLRKAILPLHRSVTRTKLLLLAPCRSHSCQMAKDCFWNHSRMPPNYYGILSSQGICDPRCRTALQDPWIRYGSWEAKRELEYHIQFAQYGSFFAILFRNLAQS